MRRAALAAILVLILAVPAQALPGSRQPLAPVAAVNEWAGWHPLGPIVFSRTLEGNADLWLVRADGSRLEQLTFSEKDDTEPAWAPGGERIVFVRTGPNGRPNLYKMNLAGGRPALFLTNGMAPSWSPDGSRIAFARTVEGNTDVYIVAKDGSDLARVTSDPDVDTDASWGPAGARMVFASDRDGDFDIYLMDPDGLAVQPLTDEATNQRNPWDLWTWRTIGYDQGGSDDDPTWCWKTIGPGAWNPPSPYDCADPGIHSYTSGTGLSLAWLVRGQNGLDHLWAQTERGEHQLTSGKRSDADPALRPAARAVVNDLTGAAGDINLGLLGAEAWVDANGSGAGADESPAGLIVQAPSLCLVDADQRSRANGTACDAGSGTGSTSVYADAEEIALARDTGQGFCLWALYQVGPEEWQIRFGTATTASDCTGRDALSATDSAW